jgi:hypothetical protein
MARVEVGSTYTDGRQVGKVVAKHPLGAVDLDLGQRATTIGIDAFRRRWWLVVASGGEQDG